MVSYAPPLQPGAFLNVCLTEPDAIRICLAAGVFNRRSTGVLVFIDFQHYIKPAHIFCSIAELHRNAQAKKDHKTKRLQAVTEVLKTFRWRVLEILNLPSGV